MRQWMIKEQIKLERMAADGYTPTEIGEEIGRTPHEVSSRLKDLGLQSQKAGYQRWTGAEMETLVRMRDIEQAAFKEIGRVMGRTWSSCKRKYDKIKAKNDGRQSIHTNRN